MISGALLVLGGVGLVLAGMRGLTSALSNTVATRLRESVVPTLERSPFAYLGGVGSTVVLSASAVTVLMAMALVERGVVGIETAVLMVLGATLGTALKTWLFVWPVTVLGPVLVGLASLVLVGTRKLGRRRLAGALLHLGLIYVGWQMAASGITPLLTMPSVIAAVDGLDLGTLFGMGIVVSAGVLAAVLVQSSTAVILVVVALLGQGAIALPTAIALMLGANVGTTVTPLLVSVEYGSGARVLAVVHIIVKAVGVGVATLFFHTFVSVSSGLSHALSVETDAGRLVMAHTVFNGLNSLIWMPAAPLLARKLLGPADQRRSIPFLARSVRRMLAGLPEEAAEEIARERDNCLRQSKIYVDSLLMTLCSHTENSGLKAPYDLRSRVLGAQELIAEVAVNGDGPLDRRIHGFLSELNALEDLIEESIGLTRRLEQEPVRVRVLRAVRLSEPLGAYAKSLNAAWHVVVYGEGDIPDRSDFTRVERAVYRELQQAGRVDEADWMEIAHQVSHLQRIWNRVVDLAQMEREPAIVEDPVKEQA